MFMPGAKSTKAFVVLSFFLAAMGVSQLAIGQDPAPGKEPRGRDVVSELRAGGYVIFFRHATTNPDQVDADAPKLDRCETQRNLSTGGRRMARDIGLAFQTLRIPVRKVVTSPYCRTVDTAELAFGHHESSDALYFVIGMDKEQRNRHSTELRQMLSTAPQPGSNTVIVSHNANLKEATGIWPKREGDAHVFRPRPGGGFDYVGEVSVDEWTRRADQTGQEARTREGL